LSAWLVVDSDRYYAARAQNIHSGAATKATRGPEAVDHIDASAHVIHSLCCPAGGRAASPRERAIPRANVYRFPAAASGGGLAGDDMHVVDDNGASQVEQVC
jgi:hypothetical protein